MIFDGKSKSVWLNLSLYVVLKSSLVHCQPRIFRTNEICGPYNGHRVYLDPGDRGDLQAKNVTVPNIPTILNGTDVTDTNNNTYMFYCNLEMVTCPSCRIKITMKFSNFPQTCTNAIPSASECDCDYLQISEPRYDPDTYGKRFCGQETVYESKTRSVNLKLIYSRNISHAFTLEYESERNRELISANPGILDTPGTHNKIITSPFFPSYYPRDFGVEHVLSCKVEACRVHVLFTDFQISPASTMEFYDWNGQRMDVVTGMSFRPPVIISTGQSMLIRFYANGGTDLGYKAKVSFLTVESSLSVPAKPFTNCGGYVETLGGAITMMNMVDSNETETKQYNCIWLIKPPNTYLHLKTHLSLNVAKLDRMAGWTELIIRQGLTSDSPVLEEIQWPRDTDITTKGFSVSWSAGFYVSLRGLFSADSEMAIVYTAFSYSNCYQGSEFACQNHRCIPIQLQCDGFDHCSDNSDENPEICQRQWSKSDMFDRRRWYAQNANYYFPKMYQHPDVRLATTLFLVCSMVFLVSSFIMLLYKTGVKSRLDRERELQSQLQTISELLDSSNRQVDDEPPNYEAPPNYDDIIKIGMENELEQSKKAEGAGGRRKSRSPHPHGHKYKNRSRRPSSQPETSNSLEVPVSEDTENHRSQSLEEGQTTLDQGTLQFLLASRLLEISEAQDAEPNAAATDQQAEPSPTLSQRDSSNLESILLTDSDAVSELSAAGIRPALSKIPSIEATNSSVNQHLWGENHRLFKVPTGPIMLSLHGSSSDSANMQQLEEDSRDFSLEPEYIPSDSNKIRLLPMDVETSLASTIRKSLLGEKSKILLCPRCKHLIKLKSIGCNRCMVEYNSRRFCSTCGALVSSSHNSFEQKEPDPDEPIPSTSKAVPAQKFCVCYTNFPKATLIPITFIQGKSLSVDPETQKMRSRYGQRKSSSVDEIDVERICARSDYQNRSLHARTNNQSLLLQSLRNQKNK